MRTSRRLLLALALCLTLATIFLAAPPPAQAIFSRCGNEFFYYSDGTYTNQVGYEVWDCDCTYSSWGTRTSYRVIEPLDC